MEPIEIKKSIDNLFVDSVKYIGILMELYTHPITNSIYRFEIFPVSFSNFTISCAVSMQCSHSIKKTATKLFPFVKSTLPSFSKFVYCVKTRLSYDFIGAIPKTVPKETTRIRIGI